MKAFMESWDRWRRGRPALTGAAEAAALATALAWLWGALGSPAALPLGAALAWGALAWTRPAPFQVACAVVLGAAVDGLSGNPLGESVAALAAGMVAANIAFTPAGRRWDVGHAGFAAVATIGAGLFRIAAGAWGPGSFAGDGNALPVLWTLAALGTAAAAIAALRALAARRRERRPRLLSTARLRP